MIFSGRRGARILAALIVLALAAPATGAEAGTGTGGEASPDAETFWDINLVDVGAAVFDVAILRPLGFAASAGGVAFFAASLPLVAPSKNIRESWDVFVMAPADYTFLRPIGEF